MNADLLRLRVGNYVFPTQAGPTGTALTFGSDGNIEASTVPVSVSGTGISDRIAVWDVSNGLRSSVATLDLSGNLSNAVNVTISGLLTTNQLISTNSVTLAGINYPTIDGVTGQGIITDGSGLLSFGPVGGVSGVGIPGRVAVWDTSTSVENSNVILDTSSNVSGINDLTADGTATLTGLVYPTLDGVDGQAMFTDGSGFLEFRSISISSETTNVGVFGSTVTETYTPHAQLDALNGIKPDVHEIFTSNSGSVTVKSDHGGREFECRTGPNVGGYGLVRTVAAVRYKPGQGVVILITARYAPPVALLAQRAGGIAVGCELSFGHDGSNGFGVLYRTGGRLESRTLTLSSPAVGAESALITLNGVGISAALTAGTVQQNASEIANNALFAANGWNAYQNNDTVLFIATTVGAKSSTYSFSSATAAGTFSQLRPGRDVSDTWVYQASWDNPTPFGMTALDPTKGNVYKIEFGYLGYAQIKYSIMHPVTGSFVKVHSIQNPNNRTVPNLDSPFFKVGFFCASLGSSTDSALYGASAYGALEGASSITDNPFSVDNTVLGVGTSLTNILSIRVRPELNSFINFSEVIPKMLSLSTDGTKPVIAQLYINSDVTGTQDWRYINQMNSSVEFDISGTSISNGRKIFTILTGKSETTTVDLTPFELILYREQTLTIAAKTTSATNDVTAAISWKEE